MPLDETLGFETGEMINCVSYCGAKGSETFYPQISDISIMLVLVYKLTVLNISHSLNLYHVVVIPEILAGGTSCGRIAVWRMVQADGRRGDSNAQWKLQTPTEIGGNVIQLQVTS